MHDPGTIATVPTDVEGVLTYSAEGGFSGLDTFEFTVRDSGGSQSPAAVQKIGVQWQIDGVVISEVMPWPSGDQRVYEYIEVYNNTAGTVDLGCLDTCPPLSSETAANLLGRSIPAGVGRILAPDPRALGHSLYLFRCEWGLFESEIIRIPSANWEALFSAPDAECSATDGSRLLIFDAAGNLLDAVDLTLAELAPPAYGESLTIHDQQLEPPGGPLNTQNNDVSAPWVYAETPGTPGVRTSLRGDVGGPMFIPTFSTGPYTPDDPCVGRCCLAQNECATLTYDECAAAEGNLETWMPGAWCEVDLADFQVFADCLAGPDATPPGGCSSQDADGDGDVDLDDFADFQIAFTSVPCP